MHLNIQKAYILLIIAGIIFSVFQNPNIVYSGVFAIIYMLVIYKFFSQDFNNVQLYTLLLFVIINSNIYLYIGSSQIYFFYIPVFVYYISLIVKLIKGRLDLFNMVSKRQILILSVLLVYMIFTIFISANRYIAISSIKGHIIMLTILVIFLMESKDIELLGSLQKVYLVLFGGVLFTGFLQILSINLGTVNHFIVSNVSLLRYPHVARVPITFFFNPNNYSLFLVVSMIIVMGNIIFSKDKNFTIANIILYLCSLINLIFAMSRTCWISLILTLGFAALMFVFTYKNNKKNLKRIIAVLLCTLIIMEGLSFIPFMQPFYGKIKQIQEMVTDQAGNPVEIGDTGSINVRATLISDVLKGVFVEKHFLGFGPGNTSAYVKGLNNTHKIYSIHSFWLEVLGDYGVFIFLVLLIIYIYKCFSILGIYLKTSEVEAKNYAFIAGLILFSLIFLTFAPSTVLNQPIFWLYLGSCFGFAENAKKKLSFR